MLPEEQSRQLPEPLKAKLRGEKFKVGYAGGMGKANALEYLIEAANLLCSDDNIEFVLIGNGDEQEKLKQLCKGNNVRFLGTLPHDQINGFLKEMDVCYIGWHKNKLYQLGISANKIYDYLYSGTPIIHSVEAYNDPIQEAGAGMSVSPESPERIKNAILEMKNTAAGKRAKMGDQGRQYVLNNFTYRQLALNYLKELKNGE